MVRILKPAEVEIGAVGKWIESSLLPASFEQIVLIGNRAAA